VVVAAVQKEINRNLQLQCSSLALEAKIIKNRNVVVADKAVSKTEPTIIEPVANVVVETEVVMKY
jgi:hypothetical protein